MKREYKITETELEVMKIVWESGAPVTSSDIVKGTKERKEWEDTTIYTLISRLVKKGFLIQSKKKNVSSYRPAITEQEYTMGQTQDLIDKLFGGDARQLISALYENRQIRSSDIEELRDYWNGGGADE